MSQIWSEKYKVTSYLVNLQGKAGLHAILNFIQDVGLQHAKHFKAYLPENRGWVFTRQKLSMQTWPHLNEVITLKTWLRPPTSDLFLMREYEMYVEDHKIGEATSTFSVIDLEKRKLIKNDWSDFSEIWRKDFHLDNEPKKINIDADTYELARFQVRNSDIDLNNHVNNTKYAQWILDSVPIEVLKEDLELVSYEVNFLAETKMGDVVSICRSKSARKEGEFQIIQFQGYRTSDQKLVFAAETKIKA